MQNQETSPGRLQRYRWPLLLLATLTVVLATGWYLWQRTYYPATDDAYLNANVIRVAAQVGGPISRVAVVDQQAVQAGDLLFEIDPAPFDIAVQQAEAQLAQTGSDISAATSAVQSAREQVKQAQAAYDEAVKNAHRVSSLAGKGAVSKADSDHATAQRDSTSAALKAARAALQEAIERRGKTGAGNARTRIARAQLSQAQLNLSYTRVRAPVAGIVSDFDLRPGSTVAAGQTLFALVETKEWWIDANFKETDLHRIHPGQPARITLDMYPDIAFRGEVESLSPASGTAFSLLPPENATGNWVKVTQRFPVRVRLLDPDPKLSLRIGASSSVTINTRSHPDGEPGPHN
jgi:membrane fusion protein (multidrug efflux system)